MESSHHTIAAADIKIKSVLIHNGTLIDFSIQKIISSIFEAAQLAGGDDHDLATRLAYDVYYFLEPLYIEKVPTVDQVQDAIEKVLIEKGHARTAKAFILNRHRKNEEKKKKELITGARENKDNLNFSNQALTILKRRYLFKDSEGNLVETPSEMVRRVAKNVALGDLLYGATKDTVQQTEDMFYQMMCDLKFLPNSPTLVNAGKKKPQLSSCVVLPIEDTMQGVFGTLREAALIHQRGSGTGFSFSRLRPKGSPVGGNLGVAAGPIAFLGVYDGALETIKQGGVRPGANMAVLRVDHPDIIRFIELKRDRQSLKNFNISVAVTDRFMKAVEGDKEYYLTNPKTEKYVGRLRARDVFAMITQNAWKTGDPGLVFIDEINRKHPAKHLGEIETTNQCGEAPLLPNEGCILGSINLNKFINDTGNILWDDLKTTVCTAVHFLDNVIDMNSYLKQDIEKQTKKTRKFGLGIMGFADMLCKLKIKYNSDEGLEFAEKLMSFIKDVTYAKSSELGEERGVCEAWEGSDHQRAGRKMRNMSCLSIAPTGTISLLADASSGCEPLFAISYQRTVLGDTDFLYLNKAFEKVARERGFYSPELIIKLARVGKIQDFKEIPKDVREIFVTAQEIDPGWHIKMQATLQKYVDNSISKTINFPRTASIKDVEEAYMFAWKSKCKGITIYRDGSYEEQVLSIGEQI